VIGTGSARNVGQSKLVFAMQVAEIMPFDAYDSDPRFEAKKPTSGGSYQQRCGDNIYHKSPEGQWKQRPSYHRPRDMARDLSGLNVLIAEHFYYFGSNAPEIPPKYGDLVPRGRGHRCNLKADVVERFLDWLQLSFEPGVHGGPANR